MRRSIQERFDEKVEVAESGCHLWTASLTKAGYGNFAYATGQPMSAHRAAWVLAGRVLPEKPLVLDHTCQVRHCVNVEHLEIVTYSENTKRGNRRTNSESCRAELHSWTPENIITNKNGSQQCRPCRREAQRKWWHAAGKPRY